ncbi:hypothetical protein [Mesorhizobium sp.]|uniref:hypothetical protein n=1 Tax=Mesorhizobium sp. TaxID=1871066 RepID=UPI000FEA1B59|nr:hypothetical protein [Mesorhizobium sp.]RWD63953.1 MAG: hypothetical protein EOS37_28485 [Mesorhizobium sp.]TIV58803.1 MAG: hypothetical protein E5V80_16750 [Mesorhizobium sp.]
MRKTVFLLSVASLCGCVAAAPAPVEPIGNPTGNPLVDPVPISLAMEEIVTAGVRQHLKNPLAAKFGTMLAGERSSNGRHEIVVCGYVDDKGIPGGNEPFIGKIYPDAGNSFELVAINDASVSGACKAAGLAMPELKPSS